MIQSTLFTLLACVSLGWGLGTTPSECPVPSSSVDLESKLTSLAHDAIYALENVDRTKFRELASFDVLACFDTNKSNLGCFVGPDHVIWPKFKHHRPIEIVYSTTSVTYRRTMLYLSWPSKQTNIHTTMIVDFNCENKIHYLGIIMHYDS